MALAEGILEKRLEPGRALETSRRIWEGRNVALLKKYIRIPNQSEHFDKKWEQTGHMEKAAQLFGNWAEERKENIPGLSVEIVRIEGKAPLIYIEIPGTIPQSSPKDESKKILLYGHYDKQPPLNKKDKDGNGGWSEGLGPWKPVRRGNRLYGRGSADDGYAMPAALTAYELLAEQGVPYAPATIIIEGNEESGSHELPAYLEKLADRIGNPDMVICLDSGAGDYERLWKTTSLRGLVAGNLKVDVMKTGVHSGVGGAVAPNSFDIATELLGRVRDSKTSKVFLPELRADVPAERLEEAEYSGALLGDDVFKSLPLLDGVRPLTDNPVDFLVRRGWEPSIAQTAVDVKIDGGGNVHSSGIDIRLSTRIAPGVVPQNAAEAMKNAFETDPPHGAHVHFNADTMSGGWNAPPTAPWLAKSIDSASRNYFKNSADDLGNVPAAEAQGGTIPFMRMLGVQFPNAQFLITGVLGPDSGAHGIDEYVEVEYVKKLNAAVAQVIADHAQAV